MTKRELQKFKVLLIKQKERSLEGLNHITKDASKSQRESAGDISSYAYHMADVATDHYDREFSMNIATSEQKVLLEIDDALKRIEDGSYGDCLECDKPIALGRLKALPYAQNCIACQQKREHKK